jgi:hypothetical protein
MDTSASIFPATLSGTQTSLFRISCTFDESVDQAVISAALTALMPRFPYFQVEMRAGFFWYYFEPSATTPIIDSDARSPCMHWSVRHRGTIPFRVRVRDRRLAVEFSHALTDGYGALTFLRALAGEYLSRKGVRTVDWGDLFRPGQEPSQEEEDDGFLKHRSRDIPWPPVASGAFRVSSRKLPSGEYRVITGTIAATALKAKAAEYKVGMNDYLTAVCLAACQELEVGSRTDGRTRRLPAIRILVPVNIRSLFPSRTMKNFILFVTPEIFPSLGAYSFEEILLRTHHYLKMEIDRKTFDRHIFRNVSGGTNPLFRILPLAGKNLLLSFLSWFYGERTYTTSLSNLGVVTMPSAFAEHIERFDFYPPPNDRTGVNCSVIGFKDVVSVSFGSLLEDRSLERNFFRILVRHGIRVRIESNFPGE